VEARERGAEDKPKSRQWEKRNLLWEGEFEFFGYTGSPRAEAYPLLPPRARSGKAGIMYAGGRTSSLLGVSFIPNGNYRGGILPVQYFQAHTRKTPVACGT